MPRASDTLPRSPVAEQIEGLRDAAEVTALDLEGVPSHETIEGEAAQTLEEFATALTRIADGSPEPAKIAQNALRLDASLKPFGDDEGTVRDLLKRS